MPLLPLSLCTGISPYSEVPVCQNPLFPLCFLNPRNAPAALCLEQEISMAVPGVVALMAVGAGSILWKPAEKVWTLNLSCCCFNAGGFVCVCASSLLLQVHLCPLYPFLLFYLSSWFLPPEQPMLHFSWIILSIPVLGSGWFLLIASPLPSISLASFGFNTFFLKKQQPVLSDFIP